MKGCDDDGRRILNTIWMVAEKKQSEKWRMGKKGAIKSCEEKQRVKLPPQEDLTKKFFQTFYLTKLVFSEMQSEFEHISRVPFD